MPVEDDIADEFTVLIRAFENRRGRLDGGFNIDESGAAQGFGCSRRIFEEPRLGEIGEECRKLWRCGQRSPALAQARDVGSTATLRLEPSAGNQRPAKVSEQPVVIEHPMERGGADDSIKDANERKVDEIAGHHRDTPAEARKMLARRMQHVPREIDGDDTPAGQSFEQFGRQKSRAASGIKDKLTAAKMQPRQDFFAPTDLRR
jgi:hypothetical protein